MSSCKLSCKRHWTSVRFLYTLLFKCLQVATELNCMPHWTSEGVSAHCCLMFTGRYRIELQTTLNFRRRLCTLLFKCLQVATELSCMPHWTSEGVSVHCSLMFTDSHRIELQTTLNFRRRLCTLLFKCLQVATELNCKRHWISVRFLCILLFKCLQVATELSCKRHWISVRFPCTLLWMKRYWRRG